MLLKFCCVEKCYSKLAQVVTLARDYRLQLDKHFCMRVRDELKQWGQDQDAVAIVMQSLRLLEGCGQGTDVGMAELKHGVPASRER